ncbi:4Fe-4S dicluster domain-containing protein [Anaeromyxobacter dehalogenans]|uniref:4Fe-4S ferredoxin, iron-sulfur binding protein n=1 Tax=Anaeromyxobacter dehalogenans (strain 2CP-C) TaxID=290397 RepID=Q2IMS3_ANADE|nr:reductive dehalogenase domain-containing protein [Anaeromyxobacter dehalogenans]ABC80105.1 4Fe-4S ferredoxin, iron-sulfur binding protein [Anaeromyxobacter dehalogenans 2CP-C]
MTKTDRYVLWGIGAAWVLDLAVFILSDYHIYAFLLLFVVAAVGLAWWGLRFPVTAKLRRNAALSVSGFWTVALVLLFGPWPVPDKPDYIVGEVHRFSEMEHGFARGLTGVTGPNIAAGGLVYGDPADQGHMMSEWGWPPNFISGNPVSRALFGGTILMERLRGATTIGGEPANPLRYSWSNFEGEKRDKKLGWNSGDYLFGEVAKVMGTQKASYTPRENALMIKSLAAWLGSPKIAIAAVDPRWFYSHDLSTWGTPLPLKDAKDLKYVIQLFTDQDWTRVHNDSGTSWWSVSNSGQAYSTSAWIGIRMAQVLRDMGYTARVGFGGMNYENIETTVSVYSGIGEYGRLSDAVVPTAGGLRFKSATIFTDFPMDVGEPNVGWGITRMCANCDRCARACPVNAVPMGEPTVENGVNMWQVDKDKCTRFRTGNLNGNMCGACLAVCPYNKPDTPFHRVGNYIIRHSPIATYLFGNIHGVGLEDWLDFEYSSEAGPYNVSRPARWIQEDPGWKAKFPYQVGQYIYTERDRSKNEEWASGVDPKMGKVGLSYKGTTWGKIPDRLVDANGRNRNVHWDYEAGELPPNLPLPGKLLTPEEATRLLLEGKAFSGASYTPDAEVFPPRDPKYEKQKLSYEQAARMWAEEK